MSNVFFIGDLHLGHKNIMKFGQRQFDTIEEHDCYMMDKWNSVVRPRDLVWVLGDVAMSIESIDLMRGFNGTKRLIIGNHDTFDTQVYLKYFETVQGVVKKYSFVMTHVPIHPHEMRYRWTHNVHGHLHKDNIPKFEWFKFKTDSRYINVNADQLDPPLIPISLDDIRKKL